MEDDHNVINYLKPNNLQRGKKKMFFSANSIPLDVHLVNPNSIWPHNGSTKKLNSEIECISCTTSRGKNSKSLQRIKMKEVGKRNKKRVQIWISCATTENQIDKIKIMQKIKKALTSTLKTTISPARIGSLLICKNKISPCMSYDCNYLAT